jgi:excisionase family DNA binding protein
MKKTCDADTLITRAEAAEILGVSTRTISRYMRDGRITKLQGGEHGRNVRVRLRDVHALQEQLDMPYLPVN